MLYPELYSTEIEAKNIKGHLTQIYQKEKKLDGVLQEFDTVYLSQVEKRVESLSLTNREFEQQFLFAKRQLLEMQIWLKIFYETASEIIPSFSHISSLELSRQKATQRVSLSLEKLTSWEASVGELRQNRGVQNIQAQISKALQAIEAKTEEGGSAFIQKQRKHFIEIVTFFESHFEKLEQVVLKQTRGLFLCDPKRSPFTAIYTLLGTVYIILEVKGHFLGVGEKKIVCRSVNLQTGEIFAALKLRTDFSYIKDKKEKEALRLRCFFGVWRESEILIKLKGKEGVVQLRDRGCFEVQGKKRLYLFEDDFHGGSLQELPSLPPLKKVQIAIQLLKGLKSIHNSGYVHGGIQPSNILLHLRLSIPIAVISGFSSAYLSTEGLEGLKFGQITLWSAPEVVQMKQRWDHPELLFKTDIWSMGCIFYTLFFDAPLPWSKEAEIVGLKAGWIPAEYKTHPLFSVIEGMLQIDPTKRLSGEEALKVMLLQVT